MRPSILAVLVVLAVAGPAICAVPPAATASVSPDAVRAQSATAPEIRAVYPNPATPNDAGEFLVVRMPAATDVSGWRLRDDESSARLPNRTLSGTVALSTDPEVARNLTDERVVGLAGHLALANGGETVRLVGNETVATVSYPDAPEGDRWHREGGDWVWEPLGATDFRVADTGPANATAFVLPDAPEAALDPLRNADDRLLVAGYTFGSARVADALADAERRGVDVRLLLDGAPVGGMTRRQARLLDSLVARGVDVRVVGGPTARYDFHHPKYAVADDRALVLTENWKPAGTGGRASRGWGVTLRNPEAADALARVFEADADGRGAIAWSAFSEGRSFEPSTPANGTFPAEIAPASVRVESTEVLVAPDNAESELVALLDAADESIRVQQSAVGGRAQPFVRAALRAARRGVEVRLLVSNAWYVESENRALVEWLNERAAAADLSLEARVARPAGRYEKIHAKGVVVDGEAAAVGSLNWNNNSARDNREVVAVLRGEEVGGYYAAAFDRDWSASAPGGEPPAVGLIGAVAVGALAAILLARREVTFER
ncbi:phospholipase D-like domain-containing protein [Halorussus marinus]|uniref:phospholipase D-like domain-containing protein n=1 Tax=Halorussus marinus TaxID=2505976 RepID=UPI00106E5AE9|nr:phospholipase D-like domain-containing protein [Halorussus marinus]